MTYAEEERAYLMDEIQRLLALARKHKHEKNDSGYLLVMEDLKDTRHALAKACGAVDQVTR
jgi:hypothetical protein